MFSIITMASSTTNPEPMVSAISDRLLRLKPHRYITAKVPISDSGTDRLGMIVAGMLRRNRKITSTTSATASDSSNSTSLTEARMVLVRSDSTVTSTLTGMELRISGSTLRIWLTTAITLAPGWRCTLSRIAGALFIQLASLLFSALGVTVATADRRTGSLFLEATMMLAYWSALEIWSLAS